MHARFCGIRGGRARRIERAFQRVFQINRGVCERAQCSTCHRYVLRYADDILRVETDFQGCGAGVSKDRKRRTAELGEPCERRVRDRFGGDSNNALIALFGADENRRAATQLSSGPFHEMVGREERRTTRPTRLRSAGFFSRHGLDIHRGQETG